MDSTDAEEDSAMDVSPLDVRAMPNDTVDFTDHIRLKTTINDLPDEIILRIMSYEFIILGSDMFIFDFPGAAAVCQKWFMIYFEMYWRKWGFLKSKKATIDQWIRLARAKNGIYATPSPRILSPRPIEIKPIVISPKSATPPPTMIPRLLEDVKSATKKIPKATSILKPEQPTTQTTRSEITQLNTSDARDLTTKDVWTVIRRGRKSSSKSTTAATDKTKEEKSKAKAKPTALPFKVLRIMS